MKVFNPVNGQLLSELTEDTADSVAHKFLAAKAAQVAWAALPLAARVECISRFKALLQEQRERLALTLTREMGKPISQSINELKAVCERIDFFLKAVARLPESEPVQPRSTGTEESITHEPLGVIANISAWNYPWFVGSNVFIPALLTGNAVLYKPSEYATLTGLALAELLHSAGVPEAIFSPIIGRGDVGALLLSQPCAGVFFTGSFATGKAIAQQLAGRMCRVQLELGGKDPIYVRHDADVAAAAESLADGAMYNAGQSCCSVERIYVHEDVALEFEAALLKAVQGLRMGDPEDADTYLGPLARVQQLQVLDEQVSDALEKGGRVVCGGKRAALSGPYYEATLILNARQDMRVMREESFGPIVAVARVKSDAEAISLMNDTDYGLTAGIYSRDETAARALMQSLNAGTVYLNCCDRVSPRLPWTGRGHSGIGTTLSDYGVRAFQQLKAWHLR